jgi:L-alanine-DL-glutamate epimerase-like enolase superfamily enzyme
MSATLMRPGVDGPTEWRRVATVAAFDVQIGHHEEPHIALHLLASKPHGTFVECCSPQRDPIYWHMLANRPSSHAGLLPVPDRPGLGWELDTDFIKRYRVDAG